MSHFVMKTATASSQADSQEISLNSNDYTMTEDGDSKPVYVTRLRNSPRLFGRANAFGNLCVTEG